MKEIKAKSALRSIKTLDKTADVSHRAKNAYIRTKGQIDQTERNDCANYVEYAEDKINKSAKNFVRKSEYTLKLLGKGAFKKIREHSADKDIVHSKARESIRPKTVQLKDKKTVKQKFAPDKAPQTAKQDLFQTQMKQATERKFAQNVNTSGKTGHTIKQADEAGRKTIKEAAKGTIKTAQKSVKTAQHTAKTAAKTSWTAAKTAAKTSMAAPRAAQASRDAARTAAVTAKTSAKAITVTVKAAIAAVKGMAALIAAGGWVTLVVILVICLAGLLSSSVFGVFFSNERYDTNTPIMTEVVSRLNEEFAGEIKRIQEENPHDSLIMSGIGSSVTASNWRDILAVYTVKVAADPKKGMDVATLDDAKVGIMRDIFRDMNKIDYWLETIDDGDDPETILYINVTSKSYADMIAEYDFNPEQVKMLDELMQDKYQHLFMQLIGSKADITLFPEEKVSC